MKNGMKNKETIILGIDPGTTIMGYGIIRTSGKNTIEMIQKLPLQHIKISYHSLKLKKI